MNALAWHCVISQGNGRHNGCPTPTLVTWPWSRFLLGSMEVIRVSFLYQQWNNMMGCCIIWKCWMKQRHNKYSCCPATSTTTWTVGWQITMSHFIIGYSLVHIGALVLRYSIKFFDDIATPTLYSMYNVIYYQCHAPPTTPRGYVGLGWSFFPAPWAGLWVIYWLISSMQYRPQNLHIDPHASDPWATIEQNTHHCGH